MKFTAILIFIAVMQVSAAGHAQSITISKQNASLETIFKEVKEQTGYLFFYNKDWISKAKKVTISVKNASLDEVLQLCFKDQQLTYAIIGKTIVLALKPQVLQPAINTTMLALQQTISGIVRDENGPLDGVSVTIKGTTRGTKTDAQGAFNLTDVKENDVLVFSFVGYAAQEIPVNGKTNFTVTLIAEQKELNSVVITALGIKRQARSLGYSTTEVDGSKLTQSRETNLGNALTGKVAGVSVAGVSTGPYGSSRVVIRGNASLKGNNQPLYVIDGVPFDNSNQGFAGQWGGVDYGDGLSTINPDDIENIQVLKGVAASALYGYRGGNGAVLITTKSGSRNKGIGVEVNNNLTFNQVVDLRDDIQYEYGQGYNGEKPTSQYGSSSSIFASWGAKVDGSDVINFAGDMVPYSAQKNNLKNFFKTGLTNQSSVALSGSNDKGHFRVALSNLYLEPVIPNSSMKQQGINFNGGFNITKKLQMTLNANYVFEQVKNRASFSDAPGNMIASVLYLASTADVRWLKKAVDENGVEIIPNVDDPYTNNPYFVAYDFQNSTKRSRLTGAFTLKYDFTNWLSLQGQVTRDGFVLDRTEITPTGTQFMYGDNGFLTQTKTDFHELNANFLFEFNKTIKDISLHATAGGNRQDNVTTIGGIYGAGPFEVPYFYSADNIKGENRPFEYQYYHFRVNSFYGSADIGYKNFLFLTATARNDWYSTLNINSNSYLYPSASSSFIFSDAFKLPAWINFGKLRASIAKSSNGTDPYRNLLTYQLEGYDINGRPIGNISQTTIPNKNLRPVRITEQEVGLNMQFLNSRVGFDVALYNKNTADDILDVAISTTSGYLSNVVNVGKLRNRGVELLLNGTPVRSKSFSWNTSFNVAFNNNKVLALTPPDNNPIPVSDDAYPRWGDAVSVQHIAGLPYAQIVGYAYKRDSKGEIVFDADGFPEQSDALPVALGSAVYKTTGGFNNDFYYKNFSLSFLFDFKFGAKIYSGTNLIYYSNGEHTATLEGRENGYIGRGVTEDGKPNTVSVRPQDYFYQITTGEHQIAEEFVYDVSFIKFRSLSLGYNFPQSMLKNGFIKSASISVVARNIAILLKHTPNIDPESNYNNTNAQGLELAGYPTVRNFGLNLNVKF